MHAHHAADVHLAGAWDETVAHHAHDGAGYDAEIGLESSPALDRADLHIGLSHPPIDHGTELCHLYKGGLGNPAGGNVLLDSCHLGDDSRVGVRKAIDPAEYFAEIDRFYRYPVLFEDLFAETDGVAVCRPRTDGANAKVAKSVHDAAGGCKLLEVVAKIV